MSKLDELQVITEADVVLNLGRTWKEGVLEYGMTDHTQTPLGRIRITFDVIRLGEVACSYHDLDIWYPCLYVDECLPHPWGHPEDSIPSAMFVGGSNPKPRKSLIYYAEEAEDPYNKFRYKWVWVIPLRYYDKNSDCYVKDSHIAVLVADLRFGLPEYNNRAVPVLHIKLYEPVSIDSLRDADS